MTVNFDLWRWPSKFQHDRVEDKEDANGQR